MPAELVQKKLAKISDEDAKPTVCHPFEARC
jgi:hypothetical protein